MVRDDAWHGGRSQLYDCLCHVWLPCSLGSCKQSKPQHIVRAAQQHSTSHRCQCNQVISIPAGTKSACGSMPIMGSQHNTNMNTHACWVPLRRLYTPVWKTEPPGLWYESCFNYLVLLLPCVQAATRGSVGAARHLGRELMHSLPVLAVEHALSLACDTAWRAWYLSRMPRAHGRRAKDI